MPAIHDARSRPTTPGDDRASAPLVLVVDDSAIVRQVLERLVSALGYDVATAGGGVEALDRLAVRNVALCLVDRRMPDMDGSEFARAVRAKGCALFLIALTGDDPADLPPGLFDAILAKPVDIADLASVLRMAFRENSP